MQLEEAICVSQGPSWEQMARALGNRRDFHKRTVYNGIRRVWRWQQGMMQDLGARSNRKPLVPAKGLGAESFQNLQPAVACWELPGGRGVLHGGTQPNHCSPAGKEPEEQILWLLSPPTQLYYLRLMLPIDQVQTEAKGQCHPHRLAARCQEQGKAESGPGWANRKYPVHSKT